MHPSTLERLLELALRRGDRVAAVNLAQRLWHAGDIRRTAVVGLRADASRPAADQDGLPSRKAAA